MPRLSAPFIIALLLALGAMGAACGGGGGEGERPAGTAEKSTPGSSTEQETATALPATEAAPETFFTYGFSFDYPVELPVAEAGLLEDEPDDASGRLRIGVEDEVTRLLKVTWVEAALFARSLMGSLDDIFEDFQESEGIETVSRGQVAEKNFRGQRMLYQFFGAVTGEGEQRHGIAAAFQCESNEIRFSFLSIDTAISGNQAILADFQTLLDSLVCDTQ